MDTQSPSAAPTPASPTPGNVSNLSPLNNLPQSPPSTSPTLPNQVEQTVGDASEGIPDVASPALNPSRVEGDFEAKSGTRERQDPQTTSPNAISPSTSNPQPPQPLHHTKKLLYLCSFSVLIISVSLLSFFFISSSRQPKTHSRAASPSPTLSLSNLSPTTAKSGGFGSLISTDSASPSVSISPISQISPVSSSSPQPTTSSPQSTTINPQPTSLPTPDSSTQSSEPHPSRVIFDITAANNSFKPNQFEAFNNQIIVFNVWATDKDYDISIAEFGVKKVFKQGARSSMEFQATSFGQYTFTCSENCAGADTAKGLLTIKP